MNMVPILRAERATVRPQGSKHDAVRDVSLTIGQGEIVSLVGPNGSGKSTLLAALAGVLRPSQGRVLLSGRKIQRHGRRALARRIARLPQEPGCPEGVTVEQVVGFGRHPYASVVRDRDPGGRSAVETALHHVGMTSFRRRAMETLSGGERRRAWLAMVLAQQSEIVLLDEPTAALDLRHQLEVLDLVRKLKTSFGRTVVIVLHDLALAARLADRMAVLHRGRIYRVGPAVQCLDSETLRDVFGVHAALRPHPDGLRLIVDRPADPRRRL